MLRRAAFPPSSHDAKALLEILESYPRDALFQIRATELFAIAMGLLGLGERPRVRLFVWRDPLERFVSCLVTIPRDRFNTENRQRIGSILLEAFRGNELDFTLQLSESLLVRVHYIVRCRGAAPESWDVASIESRLADGDPRVDRGPAGCAGGRARSGPRDRAVREVRERVSDQLPGGVARAPRRSRTSPGSRT